MTDVVDRPARAAQTRAPGRQAEPASVVAARALELVGEDPAAAMALAEDALVLARRQRDGAATTTALRAQGLAARATGDLAVAEEKLRRAVRLALRRGDDHSAAEARMTLSFVLLDAGQVRSALRQSGLASTVLDGVEGARLLAQHGLILQRCGRSDAALAEFSSALPVLREAGDHVWEARVLGNRGIMRGYLGELDAGEADLRGARALQLRAGRDVDAAISTWNLGFLASRRGDAVAALSHFDEAEAKLTESGVAVAQRAMDRADVLLSVGMSAEGHQHAMAALIELERTGQGADLVECGLLLARAALLDGRPGDAVEAARAARRRAARQQRHAWVLLARHIELRGLEEMGVHGTSLIRRAMQVAEALERSSWSAAANDAWLTAARTAVGIGKSSKAEAALDRVLEGSRRSNTDFRIQRHYAQALLRRQKCDRRGSLRSAYSALSLVQERRSTVAATDMQLGVMSSGLQIAQLAVEMAVEARAPQSVLTSLELWRAQNVRTRPVRPPKDDAESAALERLRRTTADLLSARLSGDEAVLLDSRRRRAEREVIERARLVRPAGVHARTAVRSGARLRAELAGSTLVEFFTLHDDLYAVTLAAVERRGAPAQLFSLGSLAACLREVAHIEFALARLASGRGSDVMLQAARRSAEASAHRLDTMLFASLGLGLEAGSLVVVPSDGLHSVPWSLLETTNQRPTHLVPSAAAWLGARERFEAEGSASAGKTLVVAGPGLAHAGRESAAIARGRTDVSLFAGSRATVEQVLNELGGARVAHIAAHGRFESDNPMMSSLELADGPLMVYDLEELNPPPLQVVLAACHSASARLHSGHELLGLAHALLWFGSAGVVATNLPAPDAETAELMRALHEGLASGQGVASALWNARKVVDISTPAGYATVAGFQAFGY